MSTTTRTITDDHLYSLLGAHHGDPFSALGMHQDGDRLVVRVLRPDAKTVTVQSVSDPQCSFRADRVHPDGFFMRRCCRTICRVSNTS